MTLQEIKNKFKKVCINRYTAILPNGERQWYRRGDLDNWSKEAFDRSEPYFYVEPIDLNNPYGELRLCKPKYRYMLSKKNLLTEEEYQYLFNNGS